MFTAVIEFVNGARKFLSGLNRVQCEELIKNGQQDKEISYVGVLDERF